MKNGFDFALVKIIIFFFVVTDINIRLKDKKPYSSSSTSLKGLIIPNFRRMESPLRRMTIPSFRDKPFLPKGYRQILYWKMTDAILTLVLL